MRLILYFSLIIFEYLHKTYADCNGDVSKYIIRAKIGKVCGSIVQHSRRYSEEKITTNFVGIPYAKRPEGDRRFEKPEKHHGWGFHEAWNATYQRPGCMQFNHGTYIEDCLYLNIYIPGNLSKLEHINTRSLPLLIFLISENSDTYFDKIALEMGVISAVIRYRYGAFGFLGKLNVGLHDQHMAIQWLWDNIREFGGDPQQMTLYGQDREAIHAFLHMYSFPTKKLLRRFCIHSMRNPSHSVSTVENQIPSCKFNNKSCLKHLSANDLVSSLNFTPVTDDDYVLHNFPTAWLKGLSTHVEMMIGFSVSDGLNEVENSALDGIAIPDLDDYLGRLIYLSQQTHSSTIMYTAAQLEYSSCQNLNPSLGVLNLLTDYYYSAPTEMVARIMQRQQDSMIYLYELNEGTPLYHISHDSSLSSIFLSSWKNFLFKSDPNPVLLSRDVWWSPFTEVQRDYLELSKKLTYRSMKKRLRASRHAFWNDYLPQLNSSSFCSQRDLCVQPMSVASKAKEKSDIVNYVLTALCVILGIIIIALLIKIKVPKEFWDDLKCKRRDPIQCHEMERRKLHPLPYCDETYA